MPNISRVNKYFPRDQRGIVSNSYQRIRYTSNEQTGANSNS